MRLLEKAVSTAVILSKAPAVLAQDASPLVSTESGYPFSVQFFVIAAFLLLAAWRMWLYYHHSREPGGKKGKGGTQYIEKPPEQSEKTGIPGQNKGAEKPGQKTGAGKKE